MFKKQNSEFFVLLLVFSLLIALNITAQNNVALGSQSLFERTSGNDNTALGSAAGFNVTTGSNNIMIGSLAGATLTTGSENIYILADAAVDTESLTTRIGTTQTQCFIAGIRSVTTENSDGVVVIIDSAGQLGTIASSQNVKHDIEDMGDKSADIFTLRPVTFVYNGDESNTLQYGLIAEEVEKVFPTLVIKDAEGKPETIRYHFLPIILLNEVKKQQALLDRQVPIIYKQDNVINNLTITVEAMKASIDSLQQQIQDFNKLKNGRKL